MPHPIHHITAIASDPKKCLDFYTQVLGLRLVKKTVNQDQTEAYHLFFGDRTGEPGMDLTFFTFPNLGVGRSGFGAVSKISLAVPESSMSFWQDRFDQYGVKNQGIQKEHSNQVITFFDDDNQRLQLVGVSFNDSKDDQVWTTKEVNKEHAVRSFYGASLAVFSLDLIESVLTKVLDFEKKSEKNSSYLYHLPGIKRAGVIELEVLGASDLVVSGAGTVHHIAFQVRDEVDLLETRQKVLDLGLYPTQVIDRYYFKSVYFRTQAGILFELATNGPGFTIDEDEKELGERLSLPPFLENERENIEKKLLPI